MTTSKIHYNKTNLSEYYPLLKRRVDEYFAQSKQSKYANAEMIFKTVFILSFYTITYILIMSNTLSWYWLIASFMAHGFFKAMIGLNIAHDAIHGSYSSNKTINSILGNLFNIIGGNDYLWRVKHNVIHHSYTNIPGHDDDINQTALLRLEPTQERRPIHKYQHLYGIFLYSLATISWVISKDFRNFFKEKIGEYDNTNKPKGEVARLIGYKILYYIMYIILPFAFIAQPWYIILIGFLAMHLVAGLSLSIIFQLAHTVEGTAFPEPDPKGNMEHNWAVHQLYTTADFARNNMLVNFLFGGLNFQIEHHLFPRVCHTHYRALSRIVEKTSQEFSIPYIENVTFTQAVQSHFIYLKKMGRE